MNQTADAPILPQEQIETLLGRQLTPAEEAAFDIYEEIAETKVADLLCTESLAKLMQERGWETLPLDLQLTTARFFNAISIENNAEPGVESKQVEDFHITYTANRNILAETITANIATLQKYSACGFRSGRTLKEDPRYYGDGILSV